MLAATLLLAATASAQTEEDEEITGFEGVEAPEDVEAAYHGRWRWMVGLEAGPAVPLAGSGLGGSARVELALQTPPAGGRLLPVLTLAWAGPATQGTLRDDRLPGPYEYTLWCHQGAAGLGLHLRVLDGGAAVNPELSVVPLALFHHHVLSATTADTSLGSVAESGWRPGVVAAAGVAARLGPGAITGRFAAIVGPDGSALTGRAFAADLLPTLGYRVSL